MHVISISEFQIDLAKELIERDMMTMFILDNVLTRTNIWQILLVFLASFLHYYQVVFGNVLAKHANFWKHC